MPLLEKKLYRNTLKQITEGEELLHPTGIIESWKDTLILKPENLEQDLKGLRHPQLGAIYATLSHWTCSTAPATVVMPTGTGKTETMLSLLVQTLCPKLLIIVPTDPLREQISKKFIGLGLLKEFKIVSEVALNPVVGVLKTRFTNPAEAADFIGKCNVVVTTASWMSNLPTDIFRVFTDAFKYVFIDEAHHAEAATWFQIRDKFNDSRILQFTATPYRNDGKKSRAEIIYCYPLKKAQQEGYFKKIEFIPLHEYEPTKADAAIAAKAVEILREDRKRFPHILLARVGTKKRADQVFEIYKQFQDFKVAKIYSGLKDSETIKRAISNKEYQIVVCVDMLGEGFDLPELKIAAFHDVKKSLPTTIQFTGRFTRTKHDEELGTAKIIVNIGGLKVDDNELDELYAQDNDWNELLPRISENNTQKEKDFQETLAGFNNIEDFIVSIRDLKPAMSTVIYKSASRGWSPKALEKYLKKDKRNEIVKFLENNEKKILLAVVAQKTYQSWTNNLDIFNLSWSLSLIHWNEEQGLLFIHGSDNDGLYQPIAKKLLGDDAEIIDGKNNGQIFRCLDGVSRFKLQNVGLIQLLGKLIRFQMSVGTDIEAALTKAQINRAKKSHVFGVGFENGVPVNIGCSYKGRVWSKIRDDVNVFIKWCEKIGAKVLDESIDPEQVLRGAIIPKSVPDRPPLFTVCIDWANEMYQAYEDHFRFKIEDREYSFYNSELTLIDPSAAGNIKFGLVCDNEIVAVFELQIFQASADYNDFRFVRTFPDHPVFIAYGKQEIEIEDFFYDAIPEIWFADGSVLEGSSLRRSNKKRITGNESR